MLSVASRSGADLAPDTKSPILVHAPSSQHDVHVHGVGRVDERGSVCLLWRIDAKTLLTQLAFWPLAPSRPNTKWPLLHILTLQNGYHQAVFIMIQWQFD